MSADEILINHRLLEHYTAAWSPWGRWKLNLQLRLKQILWRCKLHGGRMAKRTFDLSVSCVLLTLLCPVFLFIGLLVKLEDSGPVFFAQTRVGRNGREF